MDNQRGKFVISLDFELMWGVRDEETIKSYGCNIKGAHQIIPKILDSFLRYKISATFAVVGFLFFKTKKDLLNNLPDIKPSYKNKNFSPYHDYIDKIVGNDSKTDPYHFGTNLIDLIKNTDGQEICTHTFSHYYCLEEGQTVEQFTSDLSFAIDIAKKNDIDIKSIIFPRNQINSSYFDVCKSLGIVAYRNNENSWIYKSLTWKKENLVKRLFRFLDAYVNITGYNCYSNEYMVKDVLVNIPSSRFLRPYSYSMQLFESLRLQRIKSGMSYAAKNGLTYHLWWHPHNFGVHQEKNLSFLDKILKHYKKLNEQYEFKSYTMFELAEHLNNFKTTANKVK